YEENSNDPLLNFRMGECYIKVKEMDKALKHLESVEGLDSLAYRDLFLLLGQAYHYEGRVDEAIDAFYNYKDQLEKRKIKLSDSEKHYVNVLLKQCLTAKELMKNPVNVKIKNVGKNINSEYTDANPSITADGKTLIFTSRRPGTTGGKIDPSVEEYYDDIYMSKWDDKTNSWGPCTQLKEPINTDGHDANLSITPDGTKIFLYKNIRGETKSGDIYISEIEDDGSWGNPKPFENEYVNSTYFESSAVISADGNKMFFVSERERGGYGNGDIYVSEKVGEVWGKPENLGPVVNSVEDEIGIFIHPDGKTLFFTSKGHNTMGGYDVFMTVLEDGVWSVPVNLGYPINTTKDEIHFVFTTDRQTAYQTSNRDEAMGKYDILEIDMSNYFEENTQIDKDVAESFTGPVLSILKGAVVDAVTSKPISTNIKITDLANKEEKIVTSNQKCEYFITLPAEKKYEIQVEAPGYKPLNVKFKLPVGEGDTYVLTKHLVLTKK
ncbi:MAG: hypothetical protein C0594_03010, partial [Marinilabiliales bacterium]